MRTILPSIITLSMVLLSAAIVNAQPGKVVATLPSMQDTVETYEFTGLGSTQTYFRMPYAGAAITNPGATKYYKDKRVLKIELVYTDYPKDEDLTELNKRRLAALYALDPDLFNNPYIEWRIVKQTACHTMTEAFDFFHGFAITYADEKDFMASEYNYLEGVLNGDHTLRDSSVYKILERNKDKWKQSLIVTDLTGSMSPYAAQLLLWFKLNAKKSGMKHFVFFNDGDFTPDVAKVMGATGGIYHTDAEILDTVLQVAQNTMHNGGGGDGPENDIEALIKGLEYCPDCKDIILIADNLSTMRDYEMIDSLDRPIKVVLCGSASYSGYSYALNKEYLDLAWLTKGSLHTMEEDIENLMELNEGETIAIDGKNYKIHEGQLMRLTEM